MTLLRSFLVLVLLLTLVACSEAAIVPLVDKTITSTATLVVAYNAFRNALSCTNNDGLVSTRWGSINVTVTKGQRVPAGAHIEIRVPDAIYMISEGADVVVSCTEEVR
jgi:hypothetical protein